MDKWTKLKAAVRKHVRKIYGEDAVMTKLQIWEPDGTTGYERFKPLSRPKRQTKERKK